MVGGVRDPDISFHKGRDYARQGASRYANKHEQSGIGVRQSGQLRRGGADPATSERVLGKEHPSMLISTGQSKTNSNAQIDLIFVLLKAARQENYRRVIVI